MRNPTKNSVLRDLYLLQFLLTLFLVFLLLTSQSPHSESLQPLRILCLCGCLLIWSCSNICYMVSLSFSTTDKYPYLFLPAFFNSIAILIVEIILHGIDQRHPILRFDNVWDAVFSLTYLVVVLGQLGVVAVVLAGQVRDNVRAGLQQWAQYKQRKGGEVQRETDRESKFEEMELRESNILRDYD